MKSTLFLAKLNTSDNIPKFIYIHKKKFIANFFGQKKIKIISCNEKFVVETVDCIYKIFTLYFQENEIWLHFLNSSGISNREKSFVQNRDT